jgi:hypothetical protein
MYCPECGGEYREGFLECADCGVLLVENPPEPEEHPDLELVTVLETGDPALLAVAESLLIEAEIPYVKPGDLLQDLFALGRLGTGSNPVTGPVAVQVARENADAALQILAGIEAEESGDSGLPSEAE